VRLTPEAPPEHRHLAEARDTTRQVARTFWLACRLLPREVRDDIYLLYLVFRSLDDGVDEGSPDAAERVEAVAGWCAGAPPCTRETELLAGLAGRYPIPRGAIRDFCHGMEHDLAGAPILTEDDLDRYCYRVAGTVGVVMASVLGTDGPGAEESAAALGMAMQRTNILRDIDEDAAAGRVYLSQECLDRFGPPLPGNRRLLLLDQIARAERHYEIGVAGIPRLRRGGRAVRAAAHMYREILRQIERDGYGREPGRAVVSRRRRVAIALWAAARP
jgi:15-cis-phytoene synthase